MSTSWVYLDEQGRMMGKPLDGPPVNDLEGIRVSVRETVEAFIKTGFTLNLKSASGEAMPVPSGPYGNPFATGITIIGPCIDDVVRLRLLILREIGVESRSPRFFALPENLKNRWSRLKWLITWIWIEKRNEDH